MPTGESNPENKEAPSPSETRDGGPKEVTESTARAIGSTAISGAGGDKK